MLDELFISMLAPINAEYYDNPWVLLNDAFDADESAAEALELDFI